MGFETNYNVGGVVDRVKRIDVIGKLEEIGHIKGFPSLTQPFNKMVSLEIPPMEGDFQLDFTTPDEDVEIMAITVSCTGYSDKDRYDLMCGEDYWYENWYVSEMNEALFLGTSTYVYAAPPKTTFTMLYHNDSGCSKVVRVGYRMLRGPKLSEDQDNA